MSFVEISTTFSNEPEAVAMADRLVGCRLVACAHIDGPMASVYRWKGKVEREMEWRLTVKTRSELFDRVAEMIGEHHKYEVPQIVATQLTAISESYVKWLGAQLIETVE